MATIQMFCGNENNNTGSIPNDLELEKSNSLFKRKRKISPHKLETTNENLKIKDDEPIDLKLKEIDSMVRPISDDAHSQIKALWEKSSNIQNSQNASMSCVLSAQSQKFLNFIALQQQNNLTANKGELLNKQLIQNSMNVLMQSIPAPSTDMSNFATVNLAFNALLVHALNFQQCVDRYLQQLQESLAISAYEKHIAACVAAAVNTSSFKNQNPNLSQSDSSSSPNNSCEIFQKSVQEPSAVDLTSQQELKSANLKKSDEVFNKKDSHVDSKVSNNNIQRPKKTGGRRSGSTILVNGVLVKKSNFRGTSEEENEIDPNFRPIELDNGKILLSERYPTVTLPAETLSSLIVKSSASATRLIRLLMKSFFMQDELAASSLSGEGIYKKRLDPNITEAIKCFIRKRHPQLKTGSINLCMTDVCVQARRVSNNQRSRTTTSSTHNLSTASNHSQSSLTNKTPTNSQMLNHIENMSSNSPSSETSNSFLPTMTSQPSSLGVFPSDVREEDDDQRSSDGLPQYHQDTSSNTCHNNNNQEMSKDDEEDERQITLEEDSVPDDQSPQQTHGSQREDDQTSSTPYYNLPQKTPLNV